MFDVRTPLATAVSLFGERRKNVQVRQMGWIKGGGGGGGAGLALVRFKGPRLVTLKATQTLKKTHTH